ncbi:MAG TPA: menaquinone reductase multiheme cytochrome c subunit QrcA [Bryobacteraceae bacterium]|nr:menaquinone reductase multiheme cytochrome c subunit QrcA [Bryobacteraceae bacterium]
MKALIPFVAGAAIALSAGWAGFPHAIYKSRPQPVDFSHKVHADKAGTKCEDCHAFRGDGTFAGLPALDKCSACHAAAMGTTAEEKNFIDQYVTPGREPQWASYARQPENVYFSHITHVRRGLVKCEDCHGNIGSADHLSREEEDRISGYSRDIWGNDGRPAMTMDGCVDCHRKQKLEHSCLDCHK